MPNDFRRAERPISQLRRPLTNQELDGSVARQRGLLPQRIKQPPRRHLVDRSSIHYVWPMPSAHHQH